MATASQSQPSSQQSFTMSQQSQAGGMYRSFNDANSMLANDAPQIYSVCFRPVFLFLHSPFLFCI
jgi:hypothetical protein